MIFLSKTIIIKAAKVENGFQLIDNNGEMPLGDYVYETKREAYFDCITACSVLDSWSGKKVDSGFKVIINT